MKKNNLLAVIMLSTGLLFGACGSNETKEATESPVEAEVVLNTTHAYICPMHCENSASMEPGQCKVCGMDLVSNPDYVETAMDSTASQPMTDSTTADHENHEGHEH
jgi:hypothetical protein